MASFWEPAAREALVERARKLTPATPRRWGKMSPAAMLTHLTDAVRMAQGELPAAPKKTLLRFAPIKQLVIYVTPWPHGAPTAPELIARAPGDLASERQAFEAAVGRLAAARSASDLVPHPAFWKLSYRAWGVLLFRHIDHHLRQFGL